MNTDGAELILRWYLELEERFVSFLQVVPISDENQDVVVPSLSSIILESCSLLDTIFRDGFPAESRNANIATFATYYEGTLSLSSKRTIVYQHPVHLLRPFENWVSPAGEYSPLRWWQNYNALKHDRVKNYQLSTVRTALSSLCALHLTIAKSTVFVDALLRHGNICFGQWAVEYALDVLRGKIEGNKTVTVVIETELFGTPVGALEFPDTTEAIRPLRYSSGRKLWRFLALPPG